ncbi:MAG TPA: TetR/AcrR family transcriptional regulator [Bacillota bacterium]|nr:TetR/AcrR family transcriptional regulator [Bacillota bacterium]
MVRNAKEGTVRKNEILDIALGLFYEKGYEKTTLEDILTKTGISKGTFYYYFDAKEDVLKVLAWREAEKKLTVTRRIVEDEGLSAIDKLNQIIRESQRINLTNLEQRLKLYQAVTEYGNLEFVQRMNDHILDLGAPLIQQLLEQGITEGTMKLSDPEELARLYICIINQYLTDIRKILLESEAQNQIKPLIIKKTNFYQDFAANMLGIDPGRLILTTVTLQYLEEISIP